MPKRNPPHVALRILKDCVTQNDGKTYDLVRVMALIFLLPTICIFEWAVVYSTLGRGHFDWGGFAMACGGISSAILALAAGVSVKSRTDPMGAPPVDFPHPSPDEPRC
jgi:hypothetical protein